MAVKGHATIREQADDEESNDSEESSGSLKGSEEAAGIKEAEDLPKYAQYIDSDEADLEEDDSENEDEDSNLSEVSSSGDDADTTKDDISQKEMDLRKQLGSIPLSTLARAQRRVASKDDSETFEDSEEDEFEKDRGSKIQSDEKRRIQRQLLEKRNNKHAPTEMSSRKPVSRRRNVVETLKSGAILQRRDPRFSSLSASLPDAKLFRDSYGFLREQQSSEVAELKNIYLKLKTQEANHAGSKAKSELAMSIRAEKEKVEMALKRAEGQENERRRRERDNAVIQREKRIIQERVKRGGKLFHLKESAKKELILRDKFEKLSGGQGEDASSRRELKKAVEKRRKKNASKERRDLPPIGGGAASHSHNSGISKRKRVDYSQDKPMERKRGRRG